MKKILLIFFTLLLSVNLFAADFVFCPDVGYQMNAGLSWNFNGGFENSYFQHGSNIGLTIGTITEKGFTFYWHTSLSNFSVVTELLFGKTFYFYDDTVQLGLTGGLNIGMVSPTSLLAGFTIGPCLSLNLDYFFAKQFGVSFSITECPNYVLLGVDNLLLARFGAKFRL